MEPATSRPRTTDGIGAWSEGLRALVIWSPLVVAVALVGAVLAAGIARQAPESLVARATVGLTEESEWPFHDSTLALVDGTLDDGTIVAEARVVVGLADDEGTIETDSNSAGSRSTFLVTATAPTGQQAADLANTVAEAMLAAVPADTPVRLVNRADVPPDPPIRNSAIAGALVGLVCGLAMVPWLDRRFGLLRSTRHYEFTGRVGRWANLAADEGILPTTDVRQELLVALGGVPGPMAVLSVEAPDLATDVAKVIAVDLGMDVLDGGSVDQPGAALALGEASAVVVVAVREQHRRRRLSDVLTRLAELGFENPLVVLLPKTPPNQHP